MKSYDAIVVGAGHNGLTNAAFLAKAGLDVLCVEKNDYIGGAAVSRNLYEDWIYSNCSYVCSLLRPEIYRALELHRLHGGLQIIMLTLELTHAHIEIRRSAHGEAGGAILPCQL